MTPGAPSPQFPSTRTRVKWDNIAIVLIGVVVACFAVVGILASGAETTPTAAKPSASETTLLTDATTDEASTDAGTLTADDAQSLVEEARALMSEARWDEAADRLATVPEEFRASLGVETLEQELASTRARHEQLRAELDAAVQARQWPDAKALLASLTKLAPLDASVLETQAVIDAALTPMKPTATKAPAKDATRAGTSGATSGGGANATSATKPAAQATRPKPAATRPANGSTTGGGTRPSGGSTSATSGATAGGGATSGTAGTGATAPTAGTGAGAGTINLGALTGATLSPAEQAQLEAALAALGAA